LSDDLKVQLSADPGNLMAILAQVSRSLDGLVKDLHAVAKASESGFHLTAQKAEAMRSSMVSGAAAVHEVRNAHESWTPAIIKAGLALEAVRTVLYGLRDVGQQVLTANLDLERSQRALALATGDGAASMAFVRRIAFELGLDLVTAAQGYGMLANAARGTKMEGEGARAVFIAVSRATTAMGLDAEKTHGIFLALSQMMSKGKVMAEEMRKQLGEHLPGAFQIAARAMGVTTAELDNLLRNGKVVSDDFLPKFARQMEKELGDKPEKAANSLQANINRIRSTFQLFSYEMGQAGASAGIGEALGKINSSLASPEGIANARSLGRELGELAQILSTVALKALELRQPILGLVAAWGALQVSRIVQSLVAWGAAKVEVVAATRAATQAQVQESLASAGVTVTATSNIRAEIQRALAMLASREAIVQNTFALGAMTLADKEAEIQAIATTRAKLLEAGAASGAAASTGASIAALAGGPWGIITMALMALASAWVMVGNSAEDAAQKQLDAARDAQGNAAKFKDLSDEALRLDKILRDGKASADEKAQAQARLRLVMEQINLIMPGTIALLKEQNGLYTNAAEVTRVVAQETLKKATADREAAKSSLANAEANYKLIESEIALARSRGLTDTKLTTDTNFMGMKGKRYLGLAEADAQAEQAKNAIKKLKENYEVLIKTELDYKARLEALDAKPKTSASAGTKDKSAQLTEEEHQARLLRLHAEILKTQAAENLEAERKAKLADVEADTLDRRLKLEKERDEGKLTKGRFDQEAAALEDLRVARITQVNLEIDAKEKKLATDRARTHQDLMAQLQVQEEEGLEKRLAKIDKTFQEIRRKNLDNAAKGGELIPANLIDEAELRVKLQAWRDQVKQEMGKLKQELSEQAQIKGSALNLDDLNRSLDTFAAKGDAAAEAARRVRAELRIDATAADGMRSALDTYITTAQNKFQVWKNVTTQILQGLEGSFANFFESIFKHGMTGAQKWDALWKGIAGSVLKALAQMAAQWLVAATAEAIFHKSATAAKAGQISAALTLASAETWSAYAYIPFAGPVLALAQIELMMGDMLANIAQGKAIGAAGTVFASGGVIDRPTLALMGEAGRELVVPEVSFRTWADNLVGNLLASQARTQDYAFAAQGYVAAASGSASSRQAAGLPAFGAPMIDLRGAQIFTNDDASMGKFLRGLMNNDSGLRG
jgi:tape measure domain-containing protein